MPEAEVIAIGTELLLGEIQDTNTHYLACCLRDNSIDLHQAVIIGDNAERISQAVREALNRSDIVITTGGLGPTVDDPTREAIALAMGVETTFQPDLWEQIQLRFIKYGRPPTENNRRQAYLPVGAVAIPNPVGTAPAFYFQQDKKIVVSLPGVPRELEYLIENAVLPLLKKKYHLEGLIKAAVVHIAGVGESQVDELIGDLEILSNPTVGLRAHPGQVDIRITAKAASLSEADSLIHPILEILKTRLNDAIFGYETDTLDSVLHQLLEMKKIKLAGIEYNLGGELCRRFGEAGVAPDLLIKKDLPPDLADLKDSTRALLNEKQAGAAFGASYSSDEENQVLQMVLCLPHETIEKVRTYGGPQKSGRTWAVATSLDFLRRSIQENNRKEIA
ncbi:MAG: competence/damage-inducible protein A [Anaerolineaceae bacterium]